VQNRIRIGAVVVTIAMAMTMAARGDPISVTADHLRKAELLDQPLANDGPLDTVVVEGRTRIEVVAGTEGQEASISYGNMARQRWRLVFTTPLDKETGEGAFANLDGLANATRLTWEGRRYALGAVPSERSEDKILRPRCKRLREILAPGALSTGSALEAFQKMDMADPRLCTTGMFDRAVAAAEKDGGEAAKTLKALRDELYAALTQGVWINVTSFKATAGVLRNEFLNVGDTSISKDTDEQTVWSAELVHSWYQRNVTMISVGARYEKTAKQQKTATVCPSSDGTAPVTCTTGPVGAPEEKEHQVLFVEGKYAPALGLGGFAISPRVSYDFKDSNVGVDVPVYLLQGKKNDEGLRSFVGGIRLGWRDDEDEFIASIFVGKPFKLMGE
jgi:hypothetical protein